MSAVRLAVAGAGLIGTEHIKRISASKLTELAAIVDPSVAAQAVAKQHAVPWFSDLRSLLNSGLAQGLVLATPNHLHAEQTRLCIDAGLPTLVEKPLTHSLESARALLNYYHSVSTAPPILVGHHRAYSAIMESASHTIQSGKLGKLVAIQGSALFYKPAHYFKEGIWRTESGGGPILLNLIHEIGNLRQLAGEIRRVFTLSSNHQRGFAVEDSCAITLEFASGALGTFLLSDTAASPKSWEQTAGENKSYAHYPDQSCYHVAGTRGALSIPSMQMHFYDEATDPSWWNSFQQSTIKVADIDPLVAQIESFVRVIKGKEMPRVSIEDGFQNLRVVEAIRESARLRQMIEL